MTSILIINASPNIDGATVKLVKRVLGSRSYEQINLVDYRFGFIGQEIEDDQFDSLVEIVRSAETIVLASPIYWHNLASIMRAFLERLSRCGLDSDYVGKKLLCLYQGCKPSDKTILAIEDTIQRLIDKSQMTCLGIVNGNDEDQVRKISIEIANTL